MISTPRTILPVKQEPKGLKADVDLKPENANGAAGSTTLVDHFVGNLDRSDLRLLYLILGVLLMLSSLLWLHVLREGVEKDRAEQTLLAVRDDSAFYPKSVPTGLSS
jgi:hypothetical protein